MQENRTAASRPHRRAIVVENGKQVVLSVRPPQRLMAKAVRPRDRLVVAGVIRIVRPTISRADTSCSKGQAQTVGAGKDAFDPVPADRRATIPFRALHPDPAPSDRAGEEAAAKARTPAADDEIRHSRWPLLAALVSR